jgi:hypothetical protein
MTLGIYKTMTLDVVGEILARLFLKTGIDIYKTMTLEVVGEILARAGEDEEFRQSVLTDATRALAAYDLSPEEIRSFVDGELRALVMAGNAP